MTLSSSVTESRVRFWQAHVRALAASGLSRRGYCRRHQLSYHALTYWVRKFRQVPAHASPPALVHLGDGHMLEIDADFDAASLGRLLGVLEPRCCP